MTADTFPPVGSTVRIVREVSQAEKDLMAACPRWVYTVERYTKPHGYAVIRNVWGAWHVHPEALEVVET